ncbi:MAG: shikimate dehydrogenase [Bacteroidales bacterium]
MRHLGLTGFPLEHSFSPGYFNNKFRQEDVTDCDYVLYPVRSAREIIGLFVNDNRLEGLNVTIPWKQEVIKYLDALDESAQDAGAVNVIKADRSGNKLLLKGFNTDVYGFMASLPEELAVSTGRAIILGSGGASSAVTCALRKLKVKSVVVSRKPAPGRIVYQELTAELIAGSKLIVNTTPLGMHPDEDGKPEIDYASLSPYNFLYDLVYNPVVTEFMKEGIKRGCPVMNGQRMLELQADRAWEIWNDPSL